MLFDSQLLEAVPEVFHPQLQRYQQQFAERADSAQLAAIGACLDAGDGQRGQLLRVWLGSEYVAKACIAAPAVLLELLQSGPHRPLAPAVIAAGLAARLETCSDEQQLDSQLRRYRRQTMVHIIWRDLNRLASLEETTAALSALADASIQQAMDFHYRELVRKWGVPTGAESGQPQPLLVLAMGKLGAGELNLSSDVDLIFAYPEAGDTGPQSVAAGRSGKSLANQEFFARLGKKLIKSLDANTADGFVFRVDMRLRPYGQSGALVSNFDALEDYYQTQGREWERYAMIKARVAAVSAVPGDRARLADAAEQRLLALLRPFTYRRYIDYSAIEALRSMKSLINREVQRRGKSDDVKLGFGGIREIEFIVQAFQLIRGGRDQRLQERRLLLLLPILEAESCLPPGAAAQLDSAYRFLRNTEHALQAWQDRQTQALPAAAEERLRLARVMGFDSWEGFRRVLQGHREQVNAEFQAVVADPQRNEDERDHDWAALWQAQLDRDQALALLCAHYSDGDAARVLELLEQLRNSRHVLAMQAAGRERLDEFLPQLLCGVCAQHESAQTLERILQLVEAVARRSAYLVLLIENPGALRQLITLCAASPWIADQLVKYPALLDELLDPRTLYAPPDKTSLRDELRREVLRLGWDDLEGHMEALRYFKAAHFLRVAACEVTGILPLMKVSDYLTYIAEVVLEHVLELAWRQMMNRHGQPGRAGADDGYGFVVIGYGKLGGIELGHGSDLDLVFLHDADPGRYTDGGRQLDNQTFYTRLGQKIIHVLTAQTLGGKLYEVDMRLRPSGNSGLLVSSLNGFEKYQLDDAWTWEHQALVRARVVAGSESLAGAFAAVRARVLGRPRKPVELCGRVTEMRAKMREHLGSRSDPENGDFNIKHDSGGIVDIEFMVQYAVLAWAHQQPALMRYTDNIRILSCLEEAGLLEAHEVSQLIDAYKAYRSTGHRLALQGQASVVDGSLFAAERAAVQRIWKKLFSL